MDEAAGEVGGAHRRHRLGARVVGAGEVGRAADHLRQRRDQALERELAGRAGGDFLRRGGRLSFTARTALASACLGRSPLMRRSNSARVDTSSATKRLFQSACVPLRTLSGRAPGGENVGGNFERRMRPAELFARALDLVGAERRAVRRRLAGLGRRAVADGGLAGDHGRAIGVLCFCDGRGNRAAIVAVDARRVPAAGLEALHLVGRVGERQRAVDRDAVVVEQHDQSVELEMPGERDGFVADAFHQVAVGGDDVGLVIDDRRRTPRPCGARRSPCRPHWRGPVRAGRWWSPRRACGRIPDGRR